MVTRRLEVAHGKSEIEVVVNWGYMGGSLRGRDANIAGIRISCIIKAEYVVQFWVEGVGGCKSSDSS